MRKLTIQNVICQTNILTFAKVQNTIEFIKAKINGKNAKKMTK